MPSLSKFTLILIFSSALISFEAKSQETEVIKTLIKSDLNLVLNTPEVNSNLNLELRKPEVKTSNFQNTTHPYGDSNYKSMTAKTPSLYVLNTNNSQHFEYKEPSCSDQIIGIGLQIIGEILRNTN